MTTTAVEKPKRQHPHRKDYTDAERDAALTALIICSGHRDRAEALLAEEGIEVPAKTIYDWATRTQTERYQRLRQEIEPRLRREMADMHQSLAQSAGEIEMKAITRLKEKLDADEVEPKDLSAVMQRSAIATGIHGEKHLLYSGQPTQIIKRDATEVMRKLKARGFDFDLGPEDVSEESVSGAVS